MVLNPQQSFAVALNYRNHAEEMKLASAKQPTIFTKWASSLCGPNDELRIPCDLTDFEAELVDVLGTTARELSVENALAAVAGDCVGQDFSDRASRTQGAPAQYTLGKSYRHLFPIGPWLTTADESAYPNDLSIQCGVSGVEYQSSMTSDMVFSVAGIVSDLSHVVEPRPGDLIFTGCPHGAGQGQTPPRFLKPGERVVTEIGRLGDVENEAA